MKNKEKEKKRPSTLLRMCCVIDLKFSSIRRFAAGCSLRQRHKTRNRSIASCE